MLLRRSDRIRLVECCYYISPEYCRERSWIYHTWLIYHCYKTISLSDRSILPPNFGPKTGPNSVYRKLEKFNSTWSNPTHQFNRWIDKARVLLCDRLNNDPGPTKFLSSVIGHLEWQVSDYTLVLSHKLHILTFDWQDFSGDRLSFEDLWCPTAPPPKWRSWNRPSTVQLTWFQTIKASRGSSITADPFIFNVR